MSRKTKSKSKTKSKGKGRKNVRKPNIPATTLFSPKLNDLLASDSLMEMDVEAWERQLASMSQGIKTDAMLSTLMRATVGAPPAAKEHLEELLPVWLVRQDLHPLLLSMAESGALSLDRQRQAVRYLQAAEVDTFEAEDKLAAMEEDAKDPRFCAAYLTENEYQASIIVFYYAHQQAHHQAHHQARILEEEKVGAISFLLDFNPPWEGAVKDIAVLRPEPEQAALDYVHEVFARSGEVASIDQVDVKWRIFDALGANRREGIRLPHDLITARDLFQQHVMNLENDPDIPAFSMEDFDELAHQGRTPAALRAIEKVESFLVRLDGDKFMRIKGSNPPPIGYLNDAVQKMEEEGYGSDEWEDEDWDDEGEDETSEESWDEDEDQKTDSWKYDRWKIDARDIGFS